MSLSLHIRVIKKQNDDALLMIMVLIFVKMTSLLLYVMEFFRQSREQRTSWASFFDAMGMVKDIESNENHQREVI
jgi:hypothetical protein